MPSAAEFAATAPTLVAVATLLAVLAAAAFAVAAVLQHRAASAVPHDRSMRLGLLLTLVRNPIWLLSVVLDGAGWILQAVALQSGTLVAVQLVVVTGVLLGGLAIHAVVHRALPDAREVAGVALVVTGIGVFVAFSAEAADDATAPLRRWIVTFVVLGALCLVAVRAGGRFPGRRRAVGLAVATGIVFALTAALTRVVGDGFVADGFVGLLGAATVPLIAFAVLGAVLENSAYQAGPLSSSLPALIVADPVAAALVGWVLFAELPFTSAAGVAAGAVAAVCMVAGIALLARDLAKAVIDVDDEQPGAGDAAGTVG